MKNLISMFIAFIFSFNVITVPIAYANKTEAGIEQAWGSARRSLEINKKELEREIVFGKSIREKPLVIRLGNKDFRSVLIKLPDNIGDFTDLNPQTKDMVEQNISDQVDAMVGHLDQRIAEHVKKANILPLLEILNDKSMYSVKALGWIPTGNDIKNTSPFLTVEFKRKNDPQDRAYVVGFVNGKAINENMELLGSFYLDGDGFYIESTPEEREQFKVNIEKVMQDIKENKHLYSFEGGMHPEYLKTAVFGGVILGTLAFLVLLADVACWVPLVMIGCYELVTCVYFYDPHKHLKINRIEEPINKQSPFDCKNFEYPQLQDGQDGYIDFFNWWREQ